MKQWYALRVRSNFEKVVQQALRHRGLEGFLPTYEKRSRWSDRVKVMECPLFPGYVFGRFDSANRLPVMQMPGLIQILGNSAGPIAVAEEELNGIRFSVESGLPVEPWPLAAAGDLIIVKEGPLAGLQGVLVRVKDQIRIVVSVTLLQRSVAVELDRYCVRPVDKTSGVPGTRLGLYAADVARA